MSSSKNVCPICGNNQEFDEIHRQGPEHKYNLLLDTFQKNKRSHRNPKNGVELNVDVKRQNGFILDFNNIPDKKGNHILNIIPEDFKSRGCQIDFLCKIRNGRTRKGDDIIITAGGILHPFPHFSMIDPNGIIVQHKLQLVSLAVGETYTLIVRLQLDETTVSNFKIPFYISFQTYSQTEKMEAFFVCRSIIVSINNQTPEDAKESEKSPYTHNLWEPVLVRPANKQKSNNKKQDEFPIPKEYFKTFVYGLQKDLRDGILYTIEQKLKPNYLTIGNYKEFLHILIWLEETSCVLGISCYNMEDVRLKYIPGGFMELKVPGLAEKRPSVLKGDFIELKVQGDHTAYEGIIRNVTDTTVEIEGIFEGFVDQVADDPDTNIDVRFILRRIHFERMHQGIEQVVANGFVNNLFPDESLLENVVSENITLSKTELNNQDIFENVEQITAVQKIVNGTSKSVPYIVWGPPGTGKTVTIVEAIFQLKKLTKQRILVCAPANAACNMLTEKLAKFCNPSELKRIMSDSCDTASVHKDIIKYCNLVKNENNQLDIIRVDRSELNNYRIIVTTLVLAGKYAREYHPSILFIDEAAQAREPEACCAIGLLMQNKRLVLAGDPKQLGPVVHSEICKKYKYDSSLLERLMELPLYKNDTNNNFTTMLKLNFRSHPEILKLPNKLFYENRLQAVSASAISDPLAKTNVYQLIYKRLKQNSKKMVGSPIEFCAVLAKEQREGRSPSFYNSKEVLMVKNYVTVLTEILNVAPVDIGVVTPYIRQMYKIREALHPFGEIDVGTTEAFQGREKRVMIISTVRAQEDFLLYDSKYKLGFVAEPKRFNVAVTRAKSKLIVIGNPLILTKDEKWCQLIEQTETLGTLCGAPFPRRSLAEKKNIKELITVVSGDVEENNNTGG